MLLPIDWLKQFVAVKHNFKELAEIFVSLGFEVEKNENSFLDLEVTPNRGDCLSILGLAREYAAKTNQKLNLPALASLKKPCSSSQILSINFESPRLCPRYSAVIIKNVKIKPSSPQIQKRLKQIRQDPINNIVDITNLVMFELGQPLHAFDLNKIQGKKKTVRTAKQGESLITLDGKSHQLPQGAIVIQDNQRLIDLAGIMGGENSQISKNTTDILLQAAIFPGKDIRQTAKLLNHATEASYRFERRVDPKNTLISLDRAVQLIKQEAGGQILEILDIKNQPFKASMIKLDFSKIQRLIGTDIDKNKAIDYLARLGIKQQAEYFLSPSWRSDLIWQEDLIEEIIRIYGYDRLKKRIIKKQSYPDHQVLEKLFHKKLDLKKYLVSKGLTEIQTYSFISEKEFQALNLPADKTLKLSNPVSSEYKYLRTSFLPGMLKTMALNRWCPKDELSIFEIGKIFHPDERLSFAIATYIPELIKNLNLDLSPQIIDQQSPLAKIYKLKKSVYFCQIPISEISHIPKTNPPLKSPDEVRKFSKVTPAPRDFAWVVDETVNPEKVNQTIQRADARVVTSSLFDEFKNDKFGKGKKSMAFHTVLDNPKKSLTTLEIKQISDEIVEAVVKQHKGQLRK